MITKTESETLFESFCELHQLCWEPVPVGKRKSPDYLLRLSGVAILVEVKQIDSDQDFNTEGGVSSRTVGSHVGQKIMDSRKQVQVAKKVGLPGVFLIYNQLDPLQAFGTEQHDFVAAMYGEMTVALKHGAVADSFHGHNSSLRTNQNTSFSAVGHLRRATSGPTVRIFENVFAANALNYSSLPSCIEVIRIEVVE